MDDEDITSRERAADVLLRAAYTSSPLDIFDKADEASSGDDEWKRLARVKAGAELLAACRLARFTGEDRTQIELTNAGRYWALSGGFLGFLRDETPPQPRQGGGGGNRNPELEAMRMHFMRLRLSTFWWSFGLSLAGFFISLVSLTIILIGRDAIFP